TLELQQEVEQMLDQNPFLEADEDNTPATEPLAERLSPAERAGEREAETAGADAAAEGPEAERSADRDELGATEREDWENGTERDDFDGIRETPGTGSASNDSDDFEPQDRNPAGPSLQDHLRSQLLGM